MRGRTIALFLAAALMMVGVAPAVGAAAETGTEHSPFAFIDDPMNFCGGAIGVGSVNSVFHWRINHQGGKTTYTATGDFDVVLVGTPSRFPDATSATGRYTVVIRTTFDPSAGVIVGLPVPLAINPATGMEEFDVLDVKLTTDGVTDTGESFHTNIRVHEDETSFFAQWNCHDGNGPQTLNIP